MIISYNMILIDYIGKPYQNTMVTKKLERNNTILLGICVEERQMSRNL